MNYAGRDAIYRVSRVKKSECLFRLGGLKPQRAQRNFTQRNTKQLTKQLIIMQPHNHISIVFQMLICNAKMR